MSIGGDLGLLETSRATFNICLYSVMRHSSVISIQIFDARKFKTRDQGFLGVVNMTGADAIGYALNRHGIHPMPLTSIFLNNYFLFLHRPGHSRPRKIL